MSSPETPSWADLKKILSQLAPVLYGVAAIALVDLSASLLTSLILPDSWFLERFLGEKAKSTSHEFLAGRALVIPDKSSGWKNRPNASMHRWRTDSRGSRSSPASMSTPTSSIRAVFLGSSLINGGTHLENSETISAYFETPQAPALNFGTMLFSLDQSYLTYRDHLEQLDAEIVIVGIESPDGSLMNTYVPLLRVDQANMPFLKPRFVRRGSSLDLISPPLELLKGIPQNTDVLQFARQTDAYFGSYLSFKRYGLFPVSASVATGISKIRAFSTSFRLNDKDWELQKEIMHLFADLSAKRGAGIVFLKFSDKRASFAPWARKFIGNSEQAHDSRLRESGLPVLFARDALRELPADQVYAPDGIHTTALANQRIAAAINQHIQSHR